MGDSPYAKPPRPPEVARRNRAAELWLAGLCFLLGVIGVVPGLDWFFLIGFTLSTTIFMQAFFDHWIARVATVIVTLPLAGYAVLVLAFSLACAAGRGCL